MRRYYNPAIPEEEAKRLDWENLVLVCATQAALGSIRDEMRAIFVSAPSEGLATFHFVVRRGSEAACVEDVEDIVTEMEVLMSSVPVATSVYSEVYTEAVPPDWRALAGAASIGVRVGRPAVDRVRSEYPISRRR